MARLYVTNEMLIAWCFLWMGIAIGFVIGVVFV